MKRFIGYVLALIFGFCTGAILTSEVSAQAFEPAVASAQPGTNAAYRDGYDLGKRDAEQGLANHVAFGSWKSMRDRAQYQAGYDAGYGAVRN
jgi:hypothetical protein